MAKDYKQTAIEYADNVIAGRVIAGDDVINACKRFKADLEREDIELRMHDPNLAIGIMERTLVHKQGRIRSRWRSSAVSAICSLWV